MSSFCSSFWLGGGVPAEAKTTDAGRWAAREEQLIPRVIGCRCRRFIGTKRQPISSLCTLLVLFFLSRIDLLEIGIISAVDDVKVAIEIASDEHLAACRRVVVRCGFDLVNAILEAQGQFTDSVLVSSIQKMLRRS